MRAAARPHVRSLTSRRHGEPEHLVLVRLERREEELGVCIFPMPFRELGGVLRVLHAPRGHVDDHGRFGRGARLGGARAHLDACGTQRSSALGLGYGDRGDAADELERSGELPTVFRQLHVVVKAPNPYATGHLYRRAERATRGER